MSGETGLSLFGKTKRAKNLHDGCSILASTAITTRGSNNFSSKQPFLIRKINRSVVSLQLSCMITHGGGVGVWNGKWWYGCSCGFWRSQLRQPSRMVDLKRVTDRPGLRALEYGTNQKSPLSLGENIHTRSQNFRKVYLGP